MKLLRALGLVWVALICASASAATLPAPVAQALRQANIPESSIGLYIQDVTSDRPLVSVGEDRSLNPASTIKLLTTFAALDQLTPAYIWNTEIYATATPQAGVLNGDLIIKGYGDPGLTLENFWLMLRDLRGHGVRDIRGDLVLDRSYFALPDNLNAATFDNEPTRPYNTPPDALLVNFKAVHLQFVPDLEHHQVSVLVEPNLAQVQVLNNIVLDNDQCGDWVSRLKVTALGDANSARLLIGGNYSAGCEEKERSYSVLGHTQYVSGLFAALWAELGGTFSGKVRNDIVPANARPLLTYRNRPLTDIVRDINKYSNNLMARQLYLALGAINLGPPATAEKSERTIRQWLNKRQLTFPELVLENGSGLSRRERVSARSLAQLLLAAQRSPVMPEYMASLPLVAVDGTMRNRLKSDDVAGRAHIKTGTLEGVRAIAGYVLDTKGRLMVVVFIVNDPHAYNARQVQETVLKWVESR